jgi:hypothetical protein
LVKKGTPRHFIETSVLRSQLIGGGVVDRYYQEQFGQGTSHISRYVQMEIKNGLIAYLIEFYFTLTLPTVETIGEAFKLASQDFRTRYVKVIAAVAGELFDSRRLDRTKPRDKAKAMSALAEYIRRVELKVRSQYADAGKNNTACKRAVVPLSTKVGKEADGFIQFKNAFDDVDDCRRKCGIEKFLFRQYRQEIEIYIDESKSIKSPSTEAGFIGVAAKLEELINKGPDSVNCTSCSAIGDAIIALDAPKAMRLEHVDQSFNKLCQLISQNHYQHPSLMALFKRGLPANQGVSAASPIVVAEPLKLRKE